MRRVWARLFDAHASLSLTCPQRGHEPSGSDVLQAAFLAAGFSQREFRQL
jgi:hypothetical protein